MLLRLNFLLIMPEVKLHLLHLLLQQVNLLWSHLHRNTSALFMVQISSSRILTVEHAISGFRTSYAKLAALKYSYSKRVLTKLYSALALPHVLHILPLWDSMSKTEQLKVRSEFSRLFMFVVRFSLHCMNSFILK